MSSKEGIVADSEGALALVHNHVSLEREKHIVVYHHNLGTWQEGR
jgi:hypothetical protein